MITKVGSQVPYFEFLDGIEGKNLYDLKQRYHIVIYKAENDTLEEYENEFEKLDRDSRPIMMTSLNRKAYDSDSSREVTEIDVISDDRQENPVHELQKRDLQLLLTKGLSRAEHLIVVLYYYEEMTMKEIGATLDLSESRVSQMHSSILARLKAQMQHRCKEF